MEEIWEVGLMKYHCYYYEILPASSDPPGTDADVQLCHLSSTVKPDQLLLIIHFILYKNRLISTSWLEKKMHKSTGHMEAFNKWSLNGLWKCTVCTQTVSQAQKGPMLGLILCWKSFLKVLVVFIDYMNFEIMAYKWYPNGTIVCTKCMCPLFHSHRILVFLEQKILVDPICLGYSKFIQDADYVYSWGTVILTTAKKHSFLTQPKLALNIEEGTTNVF
jgi:hypothetical protein